MSRWRKLFGRIDPPSNDDDPESEPEPVVEDRDDRTPASPERIHSLLAHAGRPLHDGVERFELAVVDLGRLEFPSRRVAVCDPFTYRTEDLVATEARSGHVTVLRRVSPQDDRIGAAMLTLSPSESLTWEELDQYGVSAGTSCFADPAALEALSRRLGEYHDQQGDTLKGEEPLVDALDTSDALVYAVEGDLRIAAFTSGLGDGVYRTWLGRDGTGAPGVLLTSFDNIAEESGPA